MATHIHRVLHSWHSTIKHSFLLRFPNGPHLRGHETSSKENIVMHRKKFCVRGHDISVCGRYKASRACKLCYVVISKKYKENSKTYRESNRLRCLQAGWRRNGIINADGTQFKIVDYLKIKEIQDSKCFICSLSEKLLYADHNHTTGKIRGLLCRECNFSLGLLQESKERLQKAISYLEKFKG